MTGVALCGRSLGRCQRDPAARVGWRSTMQKRCVRRAAWLIRGTGALVLGLLDPPPSGAQPLLPAGPGFQVNSYTTNNQYGPSVAADADGDFVVVWQSQGSSGGDSSGYSIQGQRYTRAGSAVGSQFQVNT